MEQERHYHSLKKTSVAFLETGEMVSAPEVMTQLLRLQQLLCGYLMTDDGELKLIENNRMNVLMEVIEVGGEILDRWVKFVEVKDFERKNIFKLHMKTAKPFNRK